MLAMQFAPAASNECAGLALVQNNTNHIRLEKCLLNGSPNTAVFDWFACQTIL